MEEKKIDTKEKPIEVINIQWHQFKHHLYFLKKDNDVSSNTVANVKEVKRENYQDFQKLGGSFDVAFFNNEFVLCRNRNLKETQEVVSFKTMNLDFGVCQEIPYRGLDIINNEIILDIVQKEADAINILNQFKYGKNYFGEVKNKIYVYFGKEDNLNLSFPLHKKSNNTFLNKIKLDTKSKNNHDVTFGWHPIGYPFHIGFIDETLVLFREKSEKKKDCIEIESGKTIQGFPQSLDETNSWDRLSRIPRLTLITMVENSKMKLIRNKKQLTLLI